MLTRRTLSIAALGAAASTLGLARTSASDPSASHPKEMFRVSKTPDEWKKALTPEQYYVLRDHGTERAGTSPLDKVYAAGQYNCAGCDQALFASDTKFDSGTGWPSFYAPLDKAVGTTTDRSFFMTRTEVHCSNCGGHLGHVFDDGPKPTGKRYCMNGVAMKFVPKAAG